MKRRGISLLEVLFSVGVIAIGLLGVLAVIPLGLHQVGKGNVAERAARAGLNAVETFDVRGMRRPELWLYSPGGRVQVPTSIPLPPHVPAGYSFAIDPRFVAANGSTVIGQQPYYDARFFPYFSPLDLLVGGQNPSLITLPHSQSTSFPRMIRLSLRSAPVIGTQMGTLLADEVFVAQDELVFDRPDEKTLPPIQNFNGNVKRLHDGNFSWMATLVPRMEFGGDFRNEYLLSIVVFHKRNRSMAMFVDEDDSGGFNAGDTPSYFERLVDVATFHATGYAGGDIMLRSLSLEDLELKEGDWLMLAGSGGSGGVEAPVFKWYRVVATENEPTFNSGNGTWERDATLQGSDWQRPEWHLPASNALFRPTQATLVSGVVAVYEKTVRLETSTLWIP
jgi:type II secretory pathway pseudopilin PulG